MQIEYVEEIRGPWPFTTWRIYIATDGSPTAWSSRHHRKNLRYFLRGTTPDFNTPEACRQGWVWRPDQLNWWIAIIFAAGSFLFLIASACSLFPTFWVHWKLGSQVINGLFFAGSIPFTIAAYLQFIQAAGAATATATAEANELPGQPHSHWNQWGWHPRNIGWLSCALQWLGTVLFNANTLDAMLPGLNWFQQDLLIWVPNIVGSLLFLASGYLAFMEVGHATWSWKPSSISWWVVAVNLFGCISFLISAILAIALPDGPHPVALHYSLVFTFVGACGFLAGSLLMLPELDSTSEVQ